jgi:1,4-alpha-glucan branching enzyme
MNRLYGSEPALHRLDAEAAGFRWVVGDDRAQSVFAFLRRASQGENKPVLAVANFTPVARIRYRIGVPRPGRWIECLNTDAEAYGGSNLGNGGTLMTEAVPSHGYDQSLSLTVPPLATIWLQPE